MRGTPDRGGIKTVNEVTQLSNGKFRGELSIPYDGTRFTEEHDSREAAQAELTGIVHRHASHLLPNRPNNDGFSDAQRKDFAAALAHI